MARALSEQFTKELVQCENELNSQREQQQELRYQHDVNRIFSGREKTGAQPVQVLIAKHAATVLEVPSVTAMA